MQAFFGSELIHFHEGILGMLLGYGVESSMQFYFRDLVQKSFLLNKQQSNLQQASLYSISSLDFIHPIYFVGDPNSEEVARILKQNEKERGVIQKIYSEVDFSRSNAAETY